MRMIVFVSFDPKEVNMKLRPLASSQIRAARALLRWSAEDLARASALGLATIRRAENSENETSMTAANDLSVRRALETAGVEFIDENGGGPGVRLRKRSRPKASKT
jgi:transcriptional regulator with XRE-family HTH domain